MKTLHLFAGAGGGLLCDLILGHQPICAVEWDPYACQVLRERAAEGWFPDLSVWEGDIRLFDPSEYTGSVGCIHAGFPCQDLSNAGNKAGLGEGTRSGLYREVLRIAGIIRPRYLYLENVSAIISQADKIYIAFFERIIQADLFGAKNPQSHTGRYIRRIREIRLQAAIGRVVGDLAALGYDCKWLTLQASDVGAPHQRDRWWCLATLADSHGKRELQPEGAFGDERGRPGDSGEDVADTNKKRLSRDICKEFAIIPEKNESSSRSESCGGIAEAEQRRTWQIESGLGLLADGMADRLDADQEFRGWWEIEPDIGRATTECQHRAHQLRALGNGQVSLQAAVAWKLLGGV